jgi:hypothetical protein
MTCIELTTQILRLLAIPREALTLSPMSRRTVSDAILNLDGLQTLDIPVLPESASLKSIRSEDSAGPVFANTLHYLLPDADAETLQLVHHLETRDFHFLIHASDRNRFLLYNDDAIGRTFASHALELEQTLSLDFKITSRTPVLRLT